MKCLRLYFLLLVATMLAFSCQKEVKFDDPVNEPEPAPTDAIFSLKGSPDQCMESTLSGNYFSGVATDTSNKIILKVNVTTKGTYSLTTNEINGYLFSTSGTFESTGEQTIILIAQGTPAAESSDIFTVNTGSSSCTFTVNVQSTVQTTNDNYFPLTPNSYWLYEDLTSFGDTMKRTITPNTSSIGGKEYVIIEEKRRFTGPFLWRYRQSGADYYEFGDVVRYTGSLSYTTAVTDELYFLNQVASKGTTWESTEFSGTIQGGETILLKYVYNCLERNATVTLGGNTFTNVNIISVKPQIRSVSNGYTGTGEEYIYSYAKGIGIVYMIKIDLSVRQWEWRLKEWKIN